MIDIEEETGQIYDNFASTENDLNHVLSTFVMLICLKSNQHSKTTRMNS